jgi:hypothetical protein
MPIATLAVPDLGFLCVHEPGGRGIAGCIVGLDGRSGQSR